MDSRCPVNSNVRLTTAALQETIGLPHDLSFHFLSLHREHRLAIDDGCALVAKLCI